MGLILFKLKLFFCFLHTGSCFYSFFKFWPDPCKVNLNHQELAASINKQVIGQHIAVSHVLFAIRSHFEETEPRHALSLVLVGSTGTGKNFISSIIADNVFNGAKDHVHFYSGRLDFPLESLAEEYKVKLQNEITSKVKNCKHSIFIFDEIDKMPEGVIDAAKIFLDYHPVINGVDYRRSIFIFLTNSGGLDINTTYIKLRERGITRNYMSYQHFEPILREKLYNSNGLFRKSTVIEDYLISLYLPFLPLEKKHVEQCIRSELQKKAVAVTNDSIKRILGLMDFYNDQYSKSGCKKVADYVAFEKYRLMDNNHVEL